MPSHEESMKSVLNASAEELWRLLRGQHPEVMSAATLNRNLTEEMAVFIARSKRVSMEVMGFLANDVRFKDSYKLKLAICKNPKTPQKVTLSLLKFIKVFDIAEISRNQQISISLRQKIEYILAERIPALPSGVKTALAKRASSNIIMAIIDRSDDNVISVCLDSPVLTEGHIHTLINRPTTKGSVIQMIAQHKKWSLRYSVKFALIRNFHTSMTSVTKFIRAMKIMDLKDLYADPKLPLSTRPFIYRELLDRGQDPELQKEEVYNLTDDEDSLISYTERNDK
jgi:hypothetical protein